MGGHYKCSCGCHTDTLDDLTIALQCRWRSLSDLQVTALAGKFGNTPNSIKPFDTLNASELQQELQLKQNRT